MYECVYAAFSECKQRIKTENIQNKKTREKK